MTKQKQTVVYGMSGVGQTAKEAKQDAIDKLESLAKESGAPQFLCDNGETFVIWRDTECWAYGILRDGKLAGISFCNTKQEAYDWAAHHLAQNSLDCDDVFSVDDVPAYVTNPRHRADIVDYQVWQRAARHAMVTLNLGAGSQTVHAYACEHKHEFTACKSDRMPIATITPEESRRRQMENEKTFPVGLIDHHNDAKLACECCKRPETANGECIEDSDGAHVCNRCYWLRRDRVA
jgi:hypothetical protein